MARSMTRTVAIGARLTLGVALLTGCGPKKPADTPAAAAPAAAPTLERAGFGSSSPKVDVLAFVGYQCPHCKASSADLLAAFKAHEGVARLRIVNLPLDAHPDSVELARAAVAARKMGLWQQWWEHAFGAESVDAATIGSFAERKDVDKAKFEALRASPEVADEVAWDVALASALGVAGTPSYLVNGALLQGAQSRETWDGIVKTQSDVAAELLQKGTAPDKLMTTLIEQNSPKRAPFYIKHVLNGERPAAAPVPAKVERKSGIVGAQIAPAGANGMPVGQTLRFGDTGDDPNTVWRVLVRGDDPVRGPTAAPVTVVIFGDFECPFTAKMATTLTSLRNDLGDQVRVVWKHNPLAIHPGAAAAAKAAEAARAQGKFWEMHDALFAAGAPLDQAKIEAAATTAGLDLGAFRTALAATGADDRLAGDMEQVDALGMRGTPNLYVNGRHLIGAMELDALRTIVDEELAKAKTRLDGGTALPGLYDAIIGEGKLLSSLAAKAVTIDTTLGVTRGLPGAAVHIVAFQDFQCPFSGRLDPHLRAIEAEMDGRVKVTWMDFPLTDIHPNALLAAQAGREAQAQGKFWEFHAAAMAAQDKLDQDGLLALGKQVGMDVKALAKALESKKWAADAEASGKIARDLGLKGTPSVFINGYAFTPQLGFSAQTFRTAVQRVLRTRE